jgi:hypothetical protein
MTRRRAADDFAVIRTRIEELQRVRGRAPAEPEAQPLPPREDHAAPRRVRPRRSALSAARHPAKIPSISSIYGMRDRSVRCTAPPLDRRGG